MVVLFLLIQIIIYSLMILHFINVMITTSGYYYGGAFYIVYASDICLFRACAIRCRTPTGDNAYQFSYHHSNQNQLFIIGFIILFKKEEYTLPETFSSSL